MTSKPRIAVIGAGAFGGWTALRLLERGAHVTLIDAWGPGNSRSSSGGETRVMRGTYGPDQPYTELAARALRLWATYEGKWKRQFLHRSGVLWMASSRDDKFERESTETLRAVRIKFQQLSVAGLKKRWPQINFKEIDWGIFEPECGYLDARGSCSAVVEALVAAGGRYRQASVIARGLEESPMRALPLNDGSQLKAHIYIFACGPWLGRLFPQILSEIVKPTKQDVFFFGTPSGDTRFHDPNIPVWGDRRGHFYYGIPGGDRRGFKIADDTRGPEFDPTDGERVINAKTLKSVREYLGFRFPALRNAPLIETRVCQYEQTPDSHFIIDRHPENENVWILGGGSGHGFKHGPAIGQIMAELVLKDGEAAAIWRLDRFKKS